MEPPNLEAQNDPETLRYLGAAQVFLGSMIRRWFWQRFSLVLVPITFAAIGVFWSPMAVWAGWAGIALVFLVALFFEDQNIELKRKAYGSIELFERKILGIPWNLIMLGNRPDDSAIDAAYAKYLEFDPKAKNIANFYSTSTEATAPEVLRMRYQLTAVRAEVDARSPYCQRLKLILIVIVIALVSFALATNLAPMLIIGKIVVPAAPLLTWLLQDFAQQQRALTQLKELKLQLETAIKISATAQHNWSADFQSQLYQLRSNAPLMIGPSVLGGVKCVPLKRLSIEVVEPVKLEKKT